MKPELFVPSVPWRARALEELIVALGRQTTKIPVTFVLDGHTGPEADDVAGRARAAELDADVVNAAWFGGPGAGTRFRIVAGRADVLALSLDDDMTPSRLYVQKTLEAWERLHEPISWCGDLLDGRSYMRVTAEPETDQRLFNAGAGAMCVPSDLLRGIEDDPDAQRFLGPLGHDEAFVSWWLTRAGARLWRPRGGTGMREHPLGNDKRSQWNSHGHRCGPLLERLESRGWPVIDPPPVHGAGHGRFHGQVPAGQRRRPR